MKDTRKRKADDEFTRMAWRLSGMGFEFVSGIVGLGLAGWLVDRWAGSAPTWTITGIVLGVIGSSYNFMRQAIRAGRQAQREFDRTHPRVPNDPRSSRDSEPSTSDQLQNQVEDENE